MRALPLLFLVACPRPADSADSAPTTCAFGEPIAVSTVADTALDEISGVVASRRNPGVLWVQVDSGGPPTVTALGEDGVTRGTITLDGATNRDWEDLALGPCGDSTCLFVGEIGDNSEAHATIRVYRFEEPAPADARVTADVFEARYPDGAHDAEALVVTADGLPAILTKESGHAGVYAFPSLDATELVHLGDVMTGTTATDSGLTSLTTGADLLPDGSRLAIRTYGAIWVLDLPAGLASAPSAPRVRVTAGPELQGEAVAFTADGTGLWHVAEGRRPTLYRIPCQ